MTVFMTVMRDVNDGCRIVGSDPETVSRSDIPHGLDDPQNRQGTEQSPRINLHDGIVSHYERSRRLDMECHVKPNYAAPI